MQTGHFLRGFFSYWEIKNTMMNGDSVLLKMIMAFIYIWKKDNFLSFGIQKWLRPFLTTFWTTQLKSAKNENENLYEELHRKVVISILELFSMPIFSCAKWQNISCSQIAIHTLKHIFVSKTFYSMMAYTVSSTVWLK